VAGLAAGSVYGLAGIGLVLTYKTSGIFNFAYGSIATLAACVFYFLWVREGVPWPIAAGIVVFVLGAVVGLAMELLARHLAGLIPALQVVATIGIILIVEAGAVIWYGTQPLPFPAYLPQRGYRLGGTNVGFDQIVVFGLALAASVGLSLFFRMSRTGMAMRAVVDNADLLDLSGTNPTKVRRLSWVIGSIFAALSGVLLAPSIGLDATLLTLLVIQAFGVAAIGYFSNLPRTYVGGLLVGVASSLATKYVKTGSFLGGLPASLPFLVLIVVLVMTPPERLTLRRVAPAAPPRQPWRAPVRIRIGTGLAAVAVLAAVPRFVGTNVPVWTTFLVYVLLFLSLGLLVKTTGQISLCHLGLMAIGAAAFAHLDTRFHVPWALAVILGGLVVVPIGALIAATAIRLSGVFLALATLGFGVFLEQMFYGTRVMFGLLPSGIVSPRPGYAVFQEDDGFYWLVLGIVVVAVLGISVVSRLRLGRLLRALADSPQALETQGVPVAVTRMWVFCISAFLAGVAGAIYASQLTFIGGTSFSSFDSLTLFVLVILAVGGEPWYALIAAAGLTLIPGYVHLGDITYYLEIIFGVSAIQVALAQKYLPSVPGRVKSFLERIGNPRPATPVGTLTTVSQYAPTGNLTVAPAAPAAPGEGRSSARQPARSVLAGASSTGSDDGEYARGLAIDNLTVRYGGLVAVDGLTLVAPQGRTTGLIGPNGAGKTTAFSASTGLVRANRGSVSIHGKNVTKLSPSARAQRGLGRTFQKVSIFPSMTVLENIAMGAEAVRAGQSALRQITGKPGEQATINHIARDAAELVGISHLSDRVAGDLSTGQQRLIELARAVAGGLDVLLLDEPSSGLDEAETARFGEILRQIVRGRDMAVLLVEHDMSLALSVCDYFYVLEFGRLIFEGTREQVLGSDVVRAAYLGEEVDHVASA
jgi:ABC-type branched-subunit amino acid transport system ATPase component/branched-subunit amino acid ABC-type transport system permease component